ncbi:allantoinase AllB [Luteipulveratus sp. YIM 133132]|uniref:allantoinase AllB n=1 Tax=Luteipulveratus flavus TaxID=3031728 RepID=UPI0023B0FB72|nr:allantoinase AllB [Luteipulveratus sp. YIM 133132]MDE9364139.1 allantoinase AllB [Luteipulveratus sp. YIM 133132]
MEQPLDLVVRAERAVVDGAERPAAVGVRDGEVVAIGPVDADWSAAEDVRLAQDEVLLPGVVDTHVHVNEPGRTDWEGFETATRAALKGGTTTIVDMPLNSLPPTTTVEALDIKRAAADGECFVDVGFWGGAVPGNLEDLLPLHDEGVFGFKCFLIDSGVPEFPPLSPAELDQYLRRTALIGALMIVHAEDVGSVTEATGSTYEGFVASRPDASEVTAIERVIDAVRRSGGRAHILHLSSAQALPAIRAAKAEGLPITVETCPHYLSFAAETIADGSTTHKCCPPIRSDANRTRLWEAIADGTIDCAVSDHSPCTTDLKTPDFGTAWGGVASVQLALSAVWTEAARRGHTLADVTRWMSERPAALVGLESKGAIAVGRHADLVAFAPEESFVVEAARLEHKNKVTAYEGITLTGVARRTWLRGVLATTERPLGRLLRRGDS